MKEYGFRAQTEHRDPEGPLPLDALEEVVPEEVERKALACFCALPDESVRPNGVGACHGFTYQAFLDGPPACVPCRGTGYIDLDHEPWRVQCACATQGPRLR